MPVLLRLLLRRLLLSQLAISAGLLWLLLLAEAIQAGGQLAHQHGWITLLRHLADAGDTLWLVASAISTTWVVVRLRREGQILAIVRCGAPGLRLLTTALLLGALILGLVGSLLHGGGEIARRHLGSRPASGPTLASAPGWLGVALAADTQLIVELEGPGVLVRGPAGTTTLQATHHEPPPLHDLPPPPTGRVWLRPWAWDHPARQAWAVAGRLGIAMALVGSIACAALLMPSLALVILASGLLVISAGCASVILLVCCWRGDLGWSALILGASLAVPVLLGAYWQSRGHRRLNG